MKKEISDLFVKIYNSNNKKSSKNLDFEIQGGAYLFKQEAFNFLNNVLCYTIKTEDEIAEIFYKLGGVSSVKEGKTVLQDLNKKEIPYSLENFICFEKIKNSIKYKINLRTNNTDIH